MNPQPLEIEVQPGLFLRGQRWPGDSHTVILLHEPGVNEDLDNWRPLIPYLLGREMSVVTVDLRGHGASDGDWDSQAAINDVVAMTLATRHSGATPVVLAAAGETGNVAIRAAERTRIDGLILVSPLLDESGVPRGAGEPKLVIASSGDGAATDSARQLLRASIGQALSVSMPGSTRGSGLFAGELALTCREHVLSFLRQIELGEPIPPQMRGEPADLFLEVLGLRTKGSMS